MIDMGTSETQIKHVIGLGYHEILKYMDRVRSTRGGDSTDFVKFRPRRWVSNPFASSILLTVDRSGLRIHAS